MTRLWKCGIGAVAVLLALTGCAGTSPLPQPLPVTALPQATEGLVGVWEGSYAVGVEGRTYFGSEWLIVEAVSADGTVSAWAYAEGPKAHHNRWIPQPGTLVGNTFRYESPIAVVELRLDGDVLSGTATAKPGENWQSADLHLKRRKDR